MRISDWSSDVCSSDLARGRSVTARDPAFRCSSASRLRDEPAAGTASTVRAFLLIEHSGPWGVDALRDARLPEGLGGAVTGAAKAAKVRPLLIRRAGRRAPAEGVRVFAAFAVDRKSVVSGKRVSVRVNIGGSRILKQKDKH